MFYIINIAWFKFEFLCKGKKLTKGNNSLNQGRLLLTQIDFMRLIDTTRIESADKINPS